MFYAGVLTGYGGILYLIGHILFGSPYSNTVVMWITIFFVGIAFILMDLGYKESYSTKDEDREYII